MDRTPTRLIIFDFDGTIADTMETLIDIYNSVIAPSFGCMLFDGANKDVLRDMPLSQLMRLFKVKRLQLPFMVLRARRELARRMSSVVIQPGLAEALHDLRRPRVALGILTSNSTENVNAFIERHKLGGIFDFIRTGRNVFGKAPQLRRLVGAFGKDCPQTVYVGDEVRDIRAGKAAAVRTVAVAWGFNTVAALERERPDALVKEPRELVRAIFGGITQEV